MLLEPAENIKQMKRRLKRCQHLFATNAMQPKDLKKLVDDCVVKWPAQNNFYILRG